MTSSKLGFLFVLFVSTLEASSRISVVEGVIVVGEDDDTEEVNDREAVVPVPLDVRRVGGDGGKSPTSITLGVSNENVSAPNMIKMNQ